MLDKAVRADAGMIEQVLMNLLLNARDAMPGGGSILIETSQIELTTDYCRAKFKSDTCSYVRIRVTDSGEGIDEHDKPRIFDPFFTTKEMGKGTGLGLAMVYGIVREHDGFVDVASEIGRGTTFSVQLPALPQP